MSQKSNITPNLIRPRPPTAGYQKLLLGINKQKVEPKLIPEYFSDHFASSRRPRSTSAGTRRPPTFV